MDDQKYKGIPNILKGHRMHLGLTQEQVPERLETDPEWISHWEKGDAFPSLISAVRLANLYQTSIQALFGPLMKTVKDIDSQIIPTITSKDKM